MVSKRATVAVRRWQNRAKIDWFSREIGRNRRVFVAGSQPTTCLRGLKRERLVIVGALGCFVIRRQSVASDNGGPVFGGLEIG